MHPHLRLALLVPIFAVAACGGGAAPGDAGPPRDDGPASDIVERPDGFVDSAPADEPNADVIERPDALADVAPVDDSIVDVDERRDGPLDIVAPDEPPPDASSRDEGRDAPSDSDVDAPVGSDAAEDGPSTPSVTRTIGAAGGSLDLGDLHVTIPPGALVETQTLRVTASDDALPDGYARVSPVYHFAPEGLTFARPVTVTLGVLAAPRRASLFWSSASGPGFEPVGTTVREGVASAQVTHFSSGWWGSLHRLVDPAGETVIAAGGMTLIFPAHAVASVSVVDVTFTIDPASTEGGAPLSIGSARDLVSLIANVRPQDLVLNSPVEVRWDDFEPAPQNESIQVASEDGAWRSLRTTLSAGRASASLSRLGYVALIHDCVPPAGGAGEFACSSPIPCDASNPPTLIATELRAESTQELWCHRRHYRYTSASGAAVSGRTVTWQDRCERLDGAPGWVRVGTCDTTVVARGCDLSNCAGLSLGVSSRVCALDGVGIFSCREPAPGRSYEHIAETCVF